MAAIVGIDAHIVYSTDNGTTWLTLAERNEISINIAVDSAEHKVFVMSLADAWVEKARTWMSWSGSLNGYYDDADNTIFNTVVAGLDIDIIIFDSRADTTKNWKGKALLTSIDKSTGTDDFATLSVELEGQGPLVRNADVSLLTIPDLPA
jgi:hypothetical protein